MSTLPKIIDHALYGDLCAYIKFDNGLEVWVADSISRLKDPTTNKYRNCTEEEEALAAQLDWSGPTREMTYNEIKNLQLVCYEHWDNPNTRVAQEKYLKDLVATASKDERKRFNEACAGNFNETLAGNFIHPILETYNGKYYVDKVTDDWHYVCRRVPGQTGGMRGVDGNKMEERSWPGKNDEDWASLLLQMKVPRNPFFI